MRILNSVTQDDRWKELASISVRVEYNMAQKTEMMGLMDGEEEEQKVREAGMEEGWISGHCGV